MKLLNLKEEIKEILEELENMYEISELEEQVNNINKIRDYIINLQQENQELHNKIDKAIEYIESKEYEYGDEEQDNYIYDIGFDEVNELLDILKGMK